MGVSDTYQEKMRAVRDYHQRTKHRPDRYAASLGYMDWANQPDPFRSFAGANPMDLPHPVLRDSPAYDGLFLQSPSAAQLDVKLIGRLFYHSLALSAWKQAPGIDPWSLRINPSSGDLHPTEGYLICGPVQGLTDHPGVFHYAPLHHRLERRCRLSEQAWQALTDGIPAPCLLIALTSIYWRESWKYGERAFRYCHHDVGHAIGALSISARTLGWATQQLERLADEDLNRLLGVHLQTGIEAEHADCLLAVFPDNGDGPAQGASRVSSSAWREFAAGGVFTGEPNQLSHDHHPWPVIDEVSLATRSRPAERAITLSTAASTSCPSRLGLIPDRNQSAEQIIRQRRSAVDMDGTTSLDRSVFYQMLQRTLPGQFPFRALPWAARVSLAIFVHRVNSLDAGLYLLIRDASHEVSLRDQLNPRFEWQTPEGCPGDLIFYRLLGGDMRQRAQTISCHQAIAGKGAFALGMLAKFDASLAENGPGFYPRLFWETGLIGQVLYLEAEAAGVRGTGIGCFFDDLMHDLMGIKNDSWQSLYHFTVGGPVEDPRLKTIAPYAHAFGAARSPLTAR